MRKTRSVPLLVLFGASMLVLLCGVQDRALSINDYTAYWACRVPSVAGTATKPNLLILMDYSGSMQFHAYSSSNYVTTAGSTYDDYNNSDANIRQDQPGGTSNAAPAPLMPTTFPPAAFQNPFSYRASNTFFGLYLSDTYYKYDLTNNYWVASTLPPNDATTGRDVTQFAITGAAADPNAPPAFVKWKIAVTNGSKSDNSTTVEPGIWLTAPGHQLKVGYEVSFSGLNGHTELNDTTCTVVAVSGNDFKVLYPWQPNHKNPVAAITVDTTGQVWHPGSIILTIPGHTFKKFNVTQTAPPSALTGATRPSYRSIWFTAPGHTFPVGYQVTLAGMTKHQEMSDFTFTVMEVATDKFRIDYPFRPNAAGKDQGGNTFTGAPADYSDQSVAGYAPTAADLVVVSGMPGNSTEVGSHANMNGQAFVIRAINGNDIRVNFPFNGKPTDDYSKAKAQRRIVGQISTDLTTAGGVSGNLLNMMQTSRIDAAVRAFNGGRSGFGATTPTNPTATSLPGLSPGDPCDAVACMDDCNVNKCKTSCTAAQCDDMNTKIRNKTDYFCRLRGMGSRRYLRDGFSLNADFYIRPSDAIVGTSTTVFPNNFGTPSMLDMTTFATVFGRYRGSLFSGAPASNGSATFTAGGGSGTAYFDQWKMVLTAPTTVILRLDSSSFTGGTPKPFLALHGTGPLPDAGTLASYPVYSNIWSDTGSGATSSVILPKKNSTTSNATTNYLTSAQATSYAKLPAGTYYVRVSTSTASTTGDYTLYSNVPLTPVQTGTHAQSFQCMLPADVGAISWAQNSVQTPQADRQGVLQTSFDSVRFGFMFFNGNNNPGRIRVGLDNSSLCSLCQGFDGIFPNAGTPTGEAMAEVKAYFQQSGMNAMNSTFQGVNTTVDPYFGVPCRNSFVLLVSDGAWNGTDAATQDPAWSAYQMRTLDLRDASTVNPLAGSQTVKSFSIYAFGQGGTDGPEGLSAMKAVAMFGGYQDCKTGCSAATLPAIQNCASPTNDCNSNATLRAPYPVTTVPTSSASIGNSRTLFSPSGDGFIPKCDPLLLATDPNYYHDCCKNEWNGVWDQTVNGDGLRKGLPDNFFFASDGTKFQKALITLIQQATASNAAGGAVATQSQTGSGFGGDIVVHGLAEAAKPGSTDTYLWYGHLEAFWPYFDSTQQKYLYDFDPSLPTSDLACYQLQNKPHHCWDAALFLSAASKDSRVLFTSYFDGTNWRMRKLPKKSDFPAIPPGWTTKNAGYPFATCTDCEQCPTCTTDVCKWACRFGLTGSPFDTWDVGDFVDWIRGNKVTSTPLRDRPSTNDPNVQAVLGDITFSTPVMVGRPAVGAISTADANREPFYAERNLRNPPNQEILNRDNVVYVGANDGMLHAFLVRKWDNVNHNFVSDSAADPRIGQELWAFIPNPLMTELKYLAEVSGHPYGGPQGCVHRAMVDLAPSPFEVRIYSKTCPDQSLVPAVTTNNRCWRTVLLGGLRGGGDTYFALDVSLPVAPTFVSTPDGLDDGSNDKTLLLWEYSVLKNKIMFNRAGNALDTCTACTSNCDSKCRPADFTNVYPFLPWSSTSDPRLPDATRDAKYQQIKPLPMSWSMPIVGQLQFDPLFDMKIPIDMPTAGQTITSVVQKFDFKIHGTEFRRSIAFIGGGFRHYRDDCRVWRFPDGIPDPASPPLDAGQRFELYRPDFLAIDIESGKNLFQYIWPQIDQFYWSGGALGVPNSANPFPVQKSTTDWYVPYSMSQPTALDLLNASGEKADDGLTDHVYVGDITGRLWGIKFNLVSSPYGIQVDMWRTRDQSGNTDYFRTSRQPITVSPSVSFEGSSDPTNPTGDNVLVVFGTGKYDDTDDSFAPSHNDKSDSLKMSVYNLRDLVALPDFNNVAGKPGATAKPVIGVGGPGLNLNVTLRCPTETWLPASPGCTWTTTTGTPDHCGTTCTNCICPDCTGTIPCWNCVFDLQQPTDPTQPGERVVGHALIAGGYVWVTTYVPSTDVCSVGGNGFIYVLKYNCVPFLKSEQPLALGSTYVAPVTNFTIGSGTNQKTTAYRGDLKEGMPSEPVVDSTGNNVLIQTGGGQIIKIPISNPPQAKAWRER